MPERLDLYLTVLFANTDPSIHPTWNQPWLKKVVDSAYTYTVSKEEFELLESLELGRNFSVKGVFDYVYALQHCYDMKAQWIVMFEDDIIVADGWFVRTVQSLQKLEAKAAKSERSWLFMRLFNQERSTGWSSHKIGGNNEHWISLAVGVPVLVGLLLTRHRLPFLRPHLDDWTLGVISLLVIPAFAILFFKAGKASLLPPAPGVVEESFGCCAQGLVFPRDQVPDLINYLRKRHAGPIDNLLDDLADQANLTIHALYPVQLQHAGTSMENSSFQSNTQEVFSGIQSARGTTSKEAQAIWSMAFEQGNAEKLRREHTDLVNTIYGNFREDVS